MQRERGRAMNVDDYKVIVVPCKRCAVEFELRLPIDLYQTVVAAAEAEGEQMEFTGTCPDCRADDPFLKLLDDTGIPTAGRDFTRSLK
jgi:hypothetical protein